MTPADAGADSRPPQSTHTHPVFTQQPWHACTAAREQLLAASHGRQMLALASDLYALQSDALVKSANLTTFARLQLTSSALPIFPPPQVSHCTQG